MQWAFRCPGCGLSFTPGSGCTGRPEQSQNAINHAIHAAKERGIPVAVHLDERGDTVMSRARIKHSYMYACVAIAYVDKKTMGYAMELTGNMPYERYAMGQMIQRARDALVRGIFEYGMSDPKPTVQKHARRAVRCAERLVRMRKEPFIAGMTEYGITVVPLSERYRFVKQSACVFNGYGAWSLSDSIEYWSVPLDRRHKAYYPDAAFASDLRSTLVRDPARRLYHVIMEVQDLQDEAERRGRSAKGGMKSDDPTKL